MAGGEVRPERPTVVITRETPGRLGPLLSARGIDVIHLPLIAVAEPEDGGAEFEKAAERAAEASWLIATSPHGARRMGPVARANGHARLAAVGTATATVLESLAGRPIELVPERQTAADLVAEFPSATGRDELIIAAQSDRSAPTLVDGLRGRGFEVLGPVAYRTLLRRPPADECRVALAATGVAFASGSSALAWVQAIGIDTPPVVVAIGPTTAEVARSVGLQVSHVAADYSVEGLVDEVVAAILRMS